MFLAMAPFLPFTILILSCVLCSTFAETTFTEASVYCKMVGSCEVKKGVYDPKATAMGKFNDSYWTTGWDELHITTNPGQVGDLQAFGAGYLEAYLTHHRIWPLSHNFMNSAWKLSNASIAPKTLVDYFMANNKYMKAQVAANPNDNYWKHVGYSLSQMEGLQAGYEASHAPGKSIEALGLQMLVASGDMFVLTLKYGPRGHKDHGSEMDFKTGIKDPWPVILQRLENGHCSALFKMMDDMSDVFFGHTTWFDYNIMIRMLKTYTFNYPGIVAKTIKMSSYPGLLTSLDDFYLTSSGLAVIETSLGFMNNSLYDFVHPEGQVPYWVRAMTANRLATSPKMWAETFARHNSGTYNNQWMALNISAFKKGYGLPAGSFYVLEQMPGPYLEYADQTDFLNQDHWASYNLPFYKSLYNVAGYPAYVKKFGAMASYNGAPRAKIFRRDAGKVESFQAYQKLMRYNDFEHDPLSGGSGIGAISGRDDLTPHHPSCYGGYDSKATSAMMYNANFSFMAQNGPTYNQQPVFKFSTTKAKCYPHLEGMPDAFHFPWIPYM